MLAVRFGKDLSLLGDDKLVRHCRGGGNPGFAEDDLDAGAVELAWIPAKSMRE
jgi:hypothetical protein